jgi:hypothetical protein
MFKRKTLKGNIRKKNEQESEAIEVEPIEPNGEEEKAPLEGDKNLTQEKSESKKTSSLSFGDEMAIETNNFNKKTKGGKFRKSDGEFIPEMTVSHPPVQTDHYTPERLAELKKRSNFFVEKSKPPQGEMVVESVPQKDGKEEEIINLTEEKEGEPIFNAADIDNFKKEGLEEDDEELERFELEQIKKGSNSRSRYARERLEVLDREALDAAKSTIRIPINVEPGSQISFEDFQKKLGMMIKNLEDKNNQILRELESAEREFENLKQSLEEISKENFNTIEERNFFSELRSYVADLCDCLAEKAPLIEEFDEELMNLQIQRKKDPNSVPQFAELRGLKKKFFFS